MRLAVVIALIVVSSVIAVEPPAPTVAATVNDQPILLADLDAVVNANLPKVPITAAHRRQLRTALLDDLIDDALLKQFLAKNGLKVDVAEVDAQMKALTTKLTKENRTLTQFLKETGQTEAQLREASALQIQLAAYVKQEVTDDQLKAYHEANRDHFDKVEVRLSHIVIRTAKNAPATERSAAKEKLIALRADIAAGKTDFATAARKFSQCPSAKSGGDLGVILRRALPEEETLAKAAFALKVGTLSDIVTTDYGFHLLLVTDRKPGTPSVLEKCVLEVLEAYTDDYRVELVKKLRKDAQIRITLP
ncbi:MAG: peptidylprolyl isomerase [Planctomycetes bacterium]|nr:peptidylprolyl isomerase [Planctomycetota bacterium]